jgi:putative FmdB family regulatory protein
VPLYEYECEKCTDRFEVIQKVDAKPLRRCPKCGGKVNRLISAPAIQFRGSGWYVTDYGKGTGGKAGRKDAPTSSPGGKTSGKKTETKPGAKPGAKSGTGKKS